MKSKKFYLLSIFVVFLLGCSNDDNSPEEIESEASVPAFELIGEDESSIYRYQYDPVSESGRITNLSQEDNVNRFYITLRQVREVLSFFSLANGSFSLLQKNLLDNSTNAVDDFISISGERSIIYGATSETQILMAYYSPPNTGQLGVRTLDIATGDFVDTPLATNVFDTSVPLYFGQRLFVSYLDDTDRYQMLVFNTENLTIIRTFEFGDRFPSFFINEEGNLVLLSGLSGMFNREIYDIDRMELIEESSFQLDQFFSTGPIEAYLSGEKLYYQFNLVQPSPIATTPAIYDFLTDENTVVDLVSILEEVKAEVGPELVLTDFDYDVENGIFLLGYALGGAEITFEGGAIVISEEGELIGIEQLPFVPTYFIKPY